MKKVMLTTCVLLGLALPAARADEVVFLGVSNASGTYIGYRQIIEKKWSVENINGSPAVYGYDSIVATSLWGLATITADHDYIVKAGDNNKNAIPCAKAGAVQTFPGKLTLGVKSAQNYHYPTGSSYWADKTGQGWLFLGGGTIQFQKGLVFANGGTACLNSSITSESVIETVDGITVTAPESNPFQLYSSDNNYNAKVRFNTKITGESGTMIDSFVYSGRGAATYTFSGDMSGYMGTLWAKNKITFAFDGSATTIPGKIKLDNGAAIALAHDGAGLGSLTVSKLEIAAGASLRLSVTDAQAGMIAVTNEMILPAEGTIPIDFAITGDHPEPRTVSLLSVPAGTAGFTKERFTLAAVSGARGALIPACDFIVEPDGAGHEVLKLVINSVVWHGSTGDGYHDASIDTKTSSWDPNLEGFDPDRVYIDSTEGNIHSSRSGSTTFGGKRLVIAPSYTWHITVGINNDLTVGDFVWYGNVVTRGYSISSVTRTLRGNLTLLRSNSTSYIMSGSDGTFRLYSTLCGSGALVLTTRKCSETINANGTFEVYGTNTAFEGVFRFENDYEGGVIGHTDVKVWDSRVLGGTMTSADAYRGITIANRARLIAMDSLDFAETTRGFFVSGTGTINVTNDIDTMVIRSQLTLAGTLVKDGPGTLALGGAVRYTGDQLEAPLAGTNVVTVANGWLKALSSDSVSGMAISFAAGTGIRLSAPGVATDDEKTIGFNLASCSSFDLSACGGTLNARIDPVDETRDGSTFSLPICTVKTGTLAEENLSVKTPKFYSVAGIRSVASGGETTFFADVARKGLAVIIK